MKATTYALLSACCSAGYLLAAAAAVIFLFFNWKVSLVLLGASLALAPLGKLLDRRKSRATWGRTTGEALYALQWKNGKKGARDLAAIEASMAADYGPIWEHYGLDLSEDEATVLMCVHKLLREGKGEWGTVVETDGIEYPAVTFRIRSYPLVSLADDADKDYALLLVTMSHDRKWVKDYSLNSPAVPDV